MKKNILNTVWILFFIIAGVRLAIYGYSCSKEGLDFANSIVNSGFLLQLFLNAVMVHFFFEYIKTVEKGQFK